METKIKCICVTNRHLCERPLEEQLKRVLLASGALKSSAVTEQDKANSFSWPENAKLMAVILREKDLPEDEYYQMLCKVKSLCSGTDVLLIAHNYVDCALQAGVNAIHLPMRVLRTVPQDKISRFSTVGASTHSLEEAKEAVELGATYVTASHVFPTDCKKDLPPRGLDFLASVCAGVPVPVYALGGINFENASSCLDAGAAGVCMMSELMRL